MITSLLESVRKEYDLWFYNNSLKLEGPLGRRRKTSSPSMSRMERRLFYLFFEATDQCVGSNKCCENVLDVRTVLRLKRVTYFWRDNVFFKAVVAFFTAVARWDVCADERSRSCLV